MEMNTKGEEVSKDLHELELSTTDRKQVVLADVRRRQRVMLLVLVIVVVVIAGIVLAVVFGKPGNGSSSGVFFVGSSGHGYSDGDGDVAHVADGGKRLLRRRIKFN